MQNLTDRQLDTDRKNAQALPPAEMKSLRQQLADWEVIQKEDVPQLHRTFRFSNFAAALRFTNDVGALAEAANHHPALLTEWGKVTVSWWTHSIRGLHLNDFIMAARCDVLFEAHQEP